ncbi:MAG: hypothetical protein M3511_14115 [Deinococcota bacterium]|nr:hypothetical protein [Deinococcota bacterium]
MPEIITEIQQPKESFVKKYGGVIFWGALIAMPALNTTSAIFNYKNIRTQLEIAKIAEAVAAKK